MLACAVPSGPRTPGLEDRDGLDGLTLRYALPNGRIYRARYGPATVDFQLLAPIRSEMPGATLPYRAERLRPGLFLVVWESASFHTTFTIDLPARRLHASAWRDGRAFLGTAEILEIREGDRSPVGMDTPAH